MKLTKFNKRITHLFHPYSKVKMDINVNGSYSYLEINIVNDVSTPFESGTSTNFLALINLEERYGLKESNFDNVPEQIRTAVFETVIEFVSTPTNKR